MSCAENPPVAWYRQVKEPQQQLEDTAQLFLGMRLQCEQCHHHPYEKWSQQDYYSFAAFFSQVGRKPSGVPSEEVIFHKRGTASATNMTATASADTCSQGGSREVIHASSKSPLPWGVGFCIFRRSERLGNRSCPVAPIGPWFSHPAP